MLSVHPSSKYCTTELVITCKWYGRKGAFSRTLVTICYNQFECILLQIIAIQNIIRICLYTSITVFNVLLLRSGIHSVISKQSQDYNLQCETVSFDTFPPCFNQLILLMLVLVGHLIRQNFHIITFILSKNRLLSLHIIRYDVMLVADIDMELHS